MQVKDIEDLFKNLEDAKKNISKVLSKEDKPKFNKAIENFQKEFVRMNQNTALAEQVAKSIVDKIKL